MHMSMYRCVSVVCMNKHAYKEHVFQSISEHFNVYMSAMYTDMNTHTSTKTEKSMGIRQDVDLHVDVFVGVAEYVLLRPCLKIVSVSLLFFLSSHIYTRRHKQTNAFTAAGHRSLRASRSVFLSRTRFAPFTGRCCCCRRCLFSC